MYLSRIQYSAKYLKRSFLRQQLTAESYDWVVNACLCCGCYILLPVIPVDGENNATPK